MPVADAPDAVDWPLISAWTDALNDALMPAKLFKKRQRESIREGMRTHMNMASAGDEPFVYDSELKRMKLTGKVNLSDSVTGKSRDGCLLFAAVGFNGRVGRERDR